MKFMKLGSKPDSFQCDGDNIRYVRTELATDVTISVGDVKFHLHKFPLLSKSLRLQKLIAATNEETNDEIQIHGIPGGPTAFEICAKFCYGMTVTLNAYNVVAARCAADFLEMYESVEKGNLVFKIEVFLNTSIFRSWKDSIIVLQTTKPFLPWSEELKIVSHSLDSIASKASMDASRVEWSYSYNWKKLPSEKRSDPNWNGMRKHHAVPEDWWVEDLCELEVDLYKRVIETIKLSGRIGANIIGEALRAYTLRRLPGFGKGVIWGGDVLKNRHLVDIIVHLLPTERNIVPCRFLIELLKAANLLDCGDMIKDELMRRIGLQLGEASVSDLLIQAPEGQSTMYDVDLVKFLVGGFLMYERDGRTGFLVEDEYGEIGCHGYLSDDPKVMVAKLVDGYLSEIGRDPNLPLSDFVDLADMASSLPRLLHDGLYRAIDVYLKEHPHMSKTERKRICRLMDCKKLSREACTHAVQNDRLPLRVVVQALFFEQARRSSGGGSTPDLHRSIGSLLPAESNSSSRSATTTTINPEDDWDGSAATASTSSSAKPAADRVGGLNKARGSMVSKIFMKLRSIKDRSTEFSSSDTSESPGGSANVDDAKSAPSGGRHSVS